MASDEKTQQEPKELKEESMELPKDGTEQGKKGSGFSSEGGIPAKPEKLDEKPESRCKRIVMNIWIGAIILAFVLTLPGAYLTYDAVEKCLPWMTDLKKNLKSAWYQDLRLGHVKEDMLAAERAAKDAIRTCRYRPYGDGTMENQRADAPSKIQCNVTDRFFDKGNRNPKSDEDIKEEQDEKEKKCREKQECAHCTIVEWYWKENNCSEALYYQPEEELNDPSNLKNFFRDPDPEFRSEQWAYTVENIWQFGNYSSNIANQRKLFYSAWDHSLRRIETVGRDKYFGTEDLRKVSDAIQNIFEMFNATSDRDYCSHTHFYGCRIAHVVNETLNASYEAAAFDMFVNNPVVNTWQDYPATIRGLHVMPYLLLMALILMFLAVIKKLKGKWKWGLFPAFVFWLVALGFYGAVFIIGVQVKYGDIYLEQFKGNPPVKEIMDHVELNYPLSYKLICEDMEEGLQTLLSASYYCFAALFLAMGPFVTIAPLLCGLCAECGGRVARFSFEASTEISA